MAEPPTPKRSVIPRLLTVALLLGAVAGLAYSAAWTIERNETGVVLRFGAAVRTIPPGFHLTLPWPVETVARVPTTDVGQVSIGFKLMDQAMNIPPADEEVQWLTGDTNIIELRAMVYYTRSDPIEFLFGSSIPFLDPDQDVSAAGDMLRPSARRQLVIRKAAESVLTELVASMPIDDALSTGKTLLQNLARERTQALLDELHLGVSVSAVDVVEVSPPRDVISSFVAVTSSKADRDRRITEAMGERNSAMPKARAEVDKMIRAAETYASQVKNRARGEADRFGKIQEEVAKNRAFGMQRLWLDTMQSMLQWVEIKVVSTHGKRARIYLKE